MKLYISTTAITITTVAIYCRFYIFLTCTFDVCFSLMGVGIQCCKRNEVKESLATRHSIRVDPFASQSATYVGVALSI